MFTFLAFRLRQVCASRPKLLGYGSTAYGGFIANCNPFQYGACGQIFERLTDREIGKSPHSTPRRAGIPRSATSVTPIRHSGTRPCLPQYLAGWGCDIFAP
jgi:hypothetical protein